MSAYILKRVFYAIPIAIGVTLVVFALVHLAPGDPISAVVGDADQQMLEQMRKTYGYDKPLPVQYVTWVGRALRGDLGYSLKTGQSVASMVVPAALNTVALGICASLVAFVFGVTAGAVAGDFSDRALAKGRGFPALSGVCSPPC